MADNDLASAVAAVAAAVSHSGVYTNKVLSAMNNAGDGVVDGQGLDYMLVKNDSMQQQQAIFLQRDREQQQPIQGVFERYAATGEMEVAEEGAGNDKLTSRWTEQETLLLVECKKQELLLGLQSRGQGNAPTADEKWKMISQKMARLGSSKAKTMCKNKWENLVTAYKKVKEFISPLGQPNFWQMDNHERRKRKLPAQFMESVYNAMDSFMAEKKNVRPPLGLEGESKDGIHDGAQGLGAPVGPGKKRRKKGAQEGLISAVRDIADVAERNMERRLDRMEAKRDERMQLTEAKKDQRLQAVIDAFNRQNDKMAEAIVVLARAISNRNQ